MARARLRLPLLAALLAAAPGSAQDLAVEVGGPSVWEELEAKALREAKLELRHAKGVRGIAVEGLSQSTKGTAESAHPYFWAPFIHIGLPR